MEHVRVREGESQAPSSQTHLQFAHIPVSGGGGGEDTEGVVIPLQSFLVVSGLGREREREGGLKGEREKERQRKREGEERREGGKEGRGEGMKRGKE